MEFKGRTMGNALRLVSGNSGAHENAGNWSAYQCSDADLVGQIIHGNGRAESALFLRYREPFLGFLRSRGCNNEAEDLYHEGFLILVRRVKGGGLENPKGLRPYFRGILYRLWLAELRKTKRRRTSSASDWLEDIEDDACSPEEECEKVRRFEWLRSQIDTLSVKRDRELLRDIYLTGCDRANVCERYTITEAQLSRLLYRAKGRLRLSMLGSMP